MTPMQILLNRYCGSRDSRLYFGGRATGLPASEGRVREGGKLLEGTRRRSRAHAAVDDE